MGLILKYVANAAQIREMRRSISAPAFGRKLFPARKNLSEEPEPILSSAPESPGVSLGGALQPHVPTPSVRLGFSAGLKLSLTKYSANVGDRAQEL
jgi:hypothetical protein